MQEKLDEIERIADEMQRHLDTLSGLLKSAYATRSFPVMRATYELLREESLEMNRQADLLNQKLDSIKEKNPVKRNALLVLLTLVLLIFFSSLVVAQDTPLATNTPQIVDGTATLVSSEPLATALPGAPVIIDLPEGTDQPPVVIINPAPVNPAPTAPASEPTDRTFYVIGFVLFIVYSLARDLIAGKRENAIAERLAQAHDNKQLMAEARQRYVETSISTQEAVKLFRAIAGVVGSLNLPGIDPIADELNKIVTDVIDPPDAPSPSTPSAATDPYMGDFPTQYPGDKG